MGSPRTVAGLALAALAWASLATGATVRASDREDPPRPARTTEPARAAAQEGGAPTAADAPGSDEERAARALGRGLEWLAAEQAVVEDGSFPGAGGEQNVPVPVSALAALAFMASGSSPERGPYGRNVALATDYLLAHTDLVPGSPTYGYVESEGDSQSRMHGHGFATIALAQAWSMSPRTPRGQRLQKALGAATALIEKSQGLEGGWFYAPRSEVQHENSVTVVLVQALRAARGAGVSVDPEVISRAVDYIRRCQTEDGSFRYALSSGETSIALTAAGLTILQSAGVYQSSEIERGTEALWRALAHRAELGDEALRVPRFPHYERLYLGQALWQHSDPRLFASWIGGERERVLADQRDDGSWFDEQYGACYATAMNCLFLAIPAGLLPIFQR